MKIISLLILIFSINAFSSEETQTKTYEIKKAKPEIEFTANQTSKFNNLELWYVGISKSGIELKQTSLIPNTSNFSQKSIGLTVGKKYFNQLFNRQGFCETSLEWNQFKRTAGSSGLFLKEQDLQLYQINLFQYFSLMDFKKDLTFSMGTGISPIFATLSQSSISNSDTNVGVLVQIKTDFSYKIDQLLFSNLKSLSLNLELGLGAGKHGSNNLTSTDIKLGTNINW